MIAGPADRCERRRALDRAEIHPGEPAEIALAGRGDRPGRGREQDRAAAEAGEAADDAVRADADIGCRAGVFDEAFVLCDQAACHHTRLRSAGDGAAEDMNIADRAVVLAGECAEEYEASSPRDVDVGEVEIADRRATLDERE